jgi:hypothetical protein
MERIAGFLSRGPIVAILFVLVLANAALFLPTQQWVAPTGDGISGTPTVTHLQLSWTSEQFSHNLAEWSSEACSLEPADDAHCVWPGVMTADGIVRDPAPVADGPAGFKRATLLVDFTFPVLYSLFAIGLTIRMWGLLDRSQWLVNLVIGAGFTAAVCDFVENATHIWMLRGIDTWEQAAAADFPGFGVGLASVLASIKYGVLVLFVLAAGVWLVRWPILRLRTT